MLFNEVNEASRTFYHCVLASDVCIMFPPRNPRSRIDRAALLRDTTSLEELLRLGYTSETLVQAGFLEEEFNEANVPFPKNVKPIQMIRSNSDSLRVTDSSKSFVGASWPL